MRVPSSHWFSDIQQSRTRSDDYEHSVMPTFPWLAPPLHPTLRSLIERWGVEKELNTHDPVLGRITDKVDKLVLVKSGITARYFGSPYTSDTGSSFAFSCPGRLACGNLNFFSHRPCIGSYYAIVPSVVISVPQSLIFSLCKEDPELLLLVAREFEMINLSDRLGFGSQLFLDIENRLLAFFLTWAVAFGEVEIIDDQDWVRFPIPLRGEALRRVINCSTAAIDRYLIALKQSNQYVVESDSARIRLDLLKPVNKWIRRIEEKSSDLPRDTLTNILSDPPPPKY